MSLSAHNVEVCALAFSQHTTLCGQIDLSAYLEQAFVTVLTKRGGERDNAFDLIAQYLASPQITGTNTQAKRCLSLLEKIGVWVESATAMEFAPLLDLISTLADAAAFHNDVANQWNKVVIPKVVPLLLRLAHRSLSVLAADKKKKEKETASTGSSQIERAHLHFYFQVVYRLFANAAIRSMLLPHVKAVREVLLNYYFAQDSSEDVSDLVQCFAVLVSVESTDSWSQLLLSLSQEMIQCLLVLTLPTAKGLKEQLSYTISTSVTSQTQQSSGGFGYAPGNNQAASKLALVPHWDDIQQAFRGVQKALWIKKVFERLAMLMQEMLQVGCSSGYANVDVTAFLALYAVVLSASTDHVSTSDPANFIENEAHLSAIDLAFVLPSLKIAAIQVAHQILALNFPALIRFSSQLLQPAYSLFHKREVQHVPKLLMTILDLLAVGSVTVPNTVGHILQHGTPVLFELFAQHMDAITANRSHVSVVANNHNNNANANANTHHNMLILMGQGKQQIYDNVTDIEEANDEITVKVFQVIERLLLHGSYLLKPTVRANIENTIHQGLQCALRGILPPVVSTDKRFRRMHHVERLRQSYDLLQALLSLASVDVMVASSQSGNSQVVATVSSRNVNGLKALCLACNKLPITARHNLVYEANKSLSVLGSLLHPTAISMPYLTPADLVGKYLVQCSQATVSKAEDEKPREDTSVGSKRPLEESVAAESAAKTDKTPAKKAAKTVDTVHSSTATIPAAPAKPVNWDVKKPAAAASTATATTTMGKAAGKKPADSEDEDDLPDIDVDDD